MDTEITLGRFGPFEEAEDGFEQLLSDDDESDESLAESDT